MRSTLGVLAFFCCVLASIPANADRARDVLVHAKTAAGGAALDGIRSTHTQFSLGTRGFSGSASSLEDNLTGRFVDRYELGPATGGNGFDGDKAWSQDPSGQVRVDDADEARLIAANEAYRRSYSYWTGRRPGRIEFVGEQRDRDQRFEVVRITPEGGRPFDLWIDKSTHRIARLIEKGASRTSTSYFADFRAVQGVTVAHSIRVNFGDPKYDTQYTVESIRFNEPTEAAQFAMPAPPVRDFGFAGGASSTTVPFELINHHVYVQVRLNGRGPYRMLCDTAGANIVSPAVAKELGLPPQGSRISARVGEWSKDDTQVGRFAIGDAFLDNQPFYVLPLGTFSNVEGIPASGLVGYELFKRFVVRLDYEARTLTLTAPEHFAYDGAGTAVPFKFNQHIPQVDGEIDGIKGAFAIDIGSPSSIDLFAPFVEKHKLKGKYRPRYAGVTGWGINGPSRSALARADVLKVGGVEIKGPVTELTLPTPGAVADKGAAGSVGAGVLKRFNLVFDYGRQLIYFERNANDALPDVFDRSGMWINLTEGGKSFDVVDVMAGGPADQAGLEPGDQIVTVDGARADQVPLPELRKRFRTDVPGTRIKLEFERAGKTTGADLILRDLT